MKYLPILITTPGETDIKYWTTSHGKARRKMHTLKQIHISTNTHTHKHAYKYVNTHTHTHVHTTLKGAWGELA